MRLPAEWPCFCVQIAHFYPSPVKVPHCEALDAIEAAHSSHSTASTADGVPDRSRASPVCVTSPFTGAGRGDTTENCTSLTARTAPC